MRELRKKLGESWLGTNDAEDLIGMVCVAENFHVNDVFFKLSEDEEFNEASIAFGLYSLDNTNSVEYMRNC